MFALFGEKTERVRLKEGGSEIVHERELVGVFHSKEEACEYAASWKKKAGGFAFGSVLQGFDSFDVEEVELSPEKRK